MKRLITFVIVFTVIALGCGTERGEKPNLILDGPLMRGIDDEGRVEVGGIITNLGGKPADFVLVTLTILDQSGSELEKITVSIQGSSGPEGSSSTLYPLESASFSIPSSTQDSRAGSVQIHLDYQTP